MTTDYGICMAVEIFASIIDLILIVTCLAEKKYNDSAYNYLLLCFLACFLSVIVDIPGWLLVGNPQMVATLYTLFCFSYIFSEVAIVLFTCYLVYTIGKTTYISTSVITFVLLYVGATLALWMWGITGNTFIFIEDGRIGYTEYYWITQALPMVVLIYDIVLVLSCRKTMSKMELIAWLSLCVAPSLGLLLQDVLQSSGVAMFTSMSLVLIYIAIHAQQNVKLAEQEVELSDAKVQIMLSQMQPHLMYNTLNSIYYLIEKDPARAQKALSTFSDYLRANINSLKSSKPMLFDSELTHIKSYLDLEKMRFGSALNVVYDIQTTGFSLPPLSIQPLVENAVKHGVSQKRGGGTVWISTYEDETHFCIKVQDDGVGFEPGTVSGDGTHIGINNIRERIERVSHGHMEISSVPGEGTTAIIKLPKSYS